MAETAALLMLQKALSVPGEKGAMIPLVEREHLLSLFNEGIKQEAGKAKAMNFFIQHRCFDGYVTTHN